MKEFTTEEAAQVVADISATRIRQIANKYFADAAKVKKKKTDAEDPPFKRFGRTIVVTEAGIAYINSRGKKPGPKTAENGRKAA